jgi:hypothetical protein
MMDFVVEAEQIYSEKDFQLAAAAAGIVDGEIFLPGATNEQFATLSFRQVVNGSDMIEIKAINVLNGSLPTYQTTLPVLPPSEDYRVVASSIGYSTESQDFTLTDAGIILPDIIFTAVVP